MESLPSAIHSGHEARTLQRENEVAHKGSRRKREFIPEEKKDALYWEKRRKNNEAAKRSREKRRMNDFVLESHLMAVKEENARLSSELMAMKMHFGLVNPAVCGARQSQHLLQHTHNGSHHQALQRDYWAGRDPSVMPSHPVFIPAYAFHNMRADPYFNMSNSVGSGLLSPLVLPKNLLLTPPFHSGAPLLKPIPTRATSDEEEEQQVPRVLSLAYPAPSYKMPPRGQRSYSSPTNCMSD
ncbi:uncharacterized protein V6R79_019012 [Siganus canaliculatus]